MRSLIVHGGAWAIADQEVEAHLRGVREALLRGIALLREGRSPLEVAVETVVRLEDDPTFDAGLGSVLNAEGRIEMDASVMEGTGLRAGGCVCVTDVRNPVRLARAILEDGRAVLLAGEGAGRFARERGLETCAWEELVVERERQRKAELDRVERFKVRQPFDGSLPHASGGSSGVAGAGRPEEEPPGGADDRPGAAGPRGTVGAVCCDAKNRLASATSTGGAPNTLPGRVGDSPVLGAGTWAEDGIGAASCTGWGESILREVLAFRAVQQVDTVTIDLRSGSRTRREAAGSREAGDAPITWGPLPPGVSETAAAIAARRAIRAFARRVGGVGGLILLGPDGTPGFAFNTPRMARGFWIQGMGEPVVEIEPARSRA